MAPRAESQRPQPTPPRAARAVCECTLSRDYRRCGSPDRHAGHRTVLACPAQCLHGSSAVAAAFADAVAAAGGAAALAAVEGGRDARAQGVL
jgi:hypothetical protein